MTLRLRLTLITTLVVALVLAASAVGLHLLLANRLLSGLDDSLQQASDLLLTFVEQEDGSPTLHQEGEREPSLRADLDALLVTGSGRILDHLGSLPEALPHATPGFSTQGDLRVYTEVVRIGTGSWSLVTMRELDDVHDTLRRFDVSFALLAPVALLLAFALAYGSSRQALLPVDRLTRSALELAERRAWRERLPVPERRDELWRLSRATNTLLETLAQVIESERRFTADAAHELRTPLTVLQGRLQKALELRDPERVRTSLSKALSASYELNALVATLLDLARSDAGQHPPSEQVDLNGVAHGAAEGLRPLFVEKGLGLRLELSPDRVTVRGDGDMLSLAVRNLLGNALKFTPKGCVTLRLWADGDTVILEVLDSGPGIPETALPHLFERFYQADVRHRRSGSGLGLALALSIVTWHGGQVTAANRAEGGACVGFRLPRWQEEVKRNPERRLAPVKL